VLDEVKQYLTDQYCQPRASMPVRVWDTKITELPLTRSTCGGHQEGSAAKIENDQPVGNTKFKEGVLGRPRAAYAELVVGQAGRSLFARVADRRSREVRSYSWTRLRELQLESTQVTLRHERQHVHHVNVNGRGHLQISASKLAGTMVVRSRSWRKLLLIKPGDVFSRKGRDQLAGAHELRLGADGYGVRQDRPVPTPTTTRRPCP